MSELNSWLWPLGHWVGLLLKGEKKPNQICGRAAPLSTSQVLLSAVACASWDLHLSSLAV